MVWSRTRTRISALFLPGLSLVLAAFLAATGAFQPTSNTAHAAVVDPQVYRALADSATGQATFWVLMQERADLSVAREMDDWVARGRFVHSTLRSVAVDSQAAVLGRLASGAIPGRITRYQPFWIANVILVHGDRAAAEALARQPGVAAILPEARIDPPEPPQENLLPQATGPDVLPWGIAKINADDAWALGYRGQGVVVGGVDTGVQWDHPALKNQYRGWNGASVDHDYNWWDPSKGCSPTGSTPCDGNGHGTHTTGTAAGDDPSFQIGVAPDAQWIHAFGCCPDNEALLSALQWMAAPTDLNGDNPDPDLRPQAVNNSWGGPGGSTIFLDAIENLRAAGIVPVFSAGNNGSGCGTLGSPGDNLASFNVGATTSSDGIASFSSRGPNPFSGETGPNVSAPGDGVLSSVPTNAYSIYSGTSMAAPHVTGAVALILSAEPDLWGQVEQIEELLRQTAVQLTSTQTCGDVPGSQVPNNTFGWGRIDVMAAIEMVLDAGTLEGVVSDQGAGIPIADALVSVTRSGHTLTQRTAADGSYSFIVGAGNYQVTAEAFGYGGSTATGVGVGQDATTTQNLALSALSQGTIAGVVLESGNPGMPVQGATVTLQPDSLNISTTTGPDGAYLLDAVPFGEHTVRMTAPGYQTLASDVTVDGAESLDFAPDPVPDYVVGDGGDTCSAEYAWIDATDGVAHSLGDDASKQVNLPWSFTFYGNAYNGLYISSNGFVSFVQGYDRWHGIVPFEGPPNNQIIALGEDLNPDNGAQGTIYTKDLGDGRFVIEYHQVEHWASGNPETFEIVLSRDDGTILVQYQTVSWPDFANAGIENSDGSRGILYSYANDLPLTAGLAVKYTPFSGQAPECLGPVAPLVDIAANGANVELSWQHVDPNQQYQVWRHTSPYFDPSEGTLADTVDAVAGTNTSVDEDRIGSANSNYFYLVRGMYQDASSEASNRVGEFDFGLTPGE